MSLVLTLSLTRPPLTPVLRPAALPSVVPVLACALPEPSPEPVVSLSSVLDATVGLPPPAPAISETPELLRGLPPAAPPPFFVSPAAASLLHGRDALRQTSQTHSLPRSQKALLDVSAYI